MRKRARAHMQIDRERDRASERERERASERARSDENRPQEPFTTLVNSAAGAEELRERVVRGLRVTFSHDLSLACAEPKARLRPHTAEWLRLATPDGARQGMPFRESTCMPMAAGSM